MPALNNSLPYNAIPAGFFEQLLERVAAGFENASFGESRDINHTSYRDIISSSGYRQVSSEDLRIFALANDLRVYATPVIASLGIVTSAFYLPILLRSRRVTKSSHFHYLIALAIAGILFQTGLIIIWLGTIGINVYRVPGTCQFSAFVNHAGLFIYTWCMVFLVVDRLDHQVEVTKVPQRLKRWAGSFARHTRAKVIILGISAVALVVHLNLSMIEGAIQVGEVRMCVVILEHLRTAELLNKIDLVVNFVLPFAVMISLDVAMLYLHCNFKLHVVVPTPELTPEISDKSQAKSSPSSGPTTDRGEAEHPPIAVDGTGCRHCSYRSFTAVALSLSYMLLTLPNYVQRSLSTYNDDKLLYSMSAVGVLCQHVFSSLVYTVCLANFILLTVMDKDVQRTVLAMFSSACCRGERHSSQGKAPDVDLGAERLEERCGDTANSPV